MCLMGIRALGQFEKIGPKSPKSYEVTHEK